MTTLHDYGFLGPIGPEAHGSRACYRAGCRCLPCRSANACYEAQRLKARSEGQPPFVDAAPARAKLLRLASFHIGHRHAAKLAGVSPRTIQRIRSGQAQRIRPDVSSAILGITKYSLALGVFVNGYETRHYVESLVREGFTKTSLALRLGLRGARLRLGAKVTARTALKLSKLHERLTAE